MKLFSINLHICYNTIRSNTSFIKLALRKKRPNTEFFLVRIFLYSDQKTLRTWALFTQCGSIDMDLKSANNIEILTFGIRQILATFHLSGIIDDSYL